MDRPDEALGLAVVAERLARRLHAAGQGRVGDDASVPDLLEQLIPGNEALAVFNEEGEEGEHLRLERADPSPGTQLDLGQVELELAEPVFHWDQGRTPWESIARESP